MVDEDPARLHLEVYDTKSGLWHPELGDLDQPDGWDLLPAGDAFLTRQVKAAGAYWVLFRPKGRGQHRHQLGLLAPIESIAAAREAAAVTAAMIPKVPLWITPQPSTFDAKAPPRP